MANSIFPPMDGSIGNASALFAPRPLQFLARRLPQPKDDNYVPAMLTGLIVPLRAIPDEASSRKTIR